MQLKSGSLLFKSGSFQDMTSDNRRLSWYLSFARRARKIAHKGIFFPRRAIFLARRANLTGGGWVEVRWRFGGGSEASRFFQMIIYQNLTKKFVP
jgi:hypothetical protein